MGIGRYRSLHLEERRILRNDIVTGQGGSQILLDDPAGNPIELFEPPQR